MVSQGKDYLLLYNDVLTLTGMHGRPGCKIQLLLTHRRKSEVCQCEMGVSCQRFISNLWYIGCLISGNKCLQMFLDKQVCLWHETAK